VAFNTDSKHRKTWKAALFTFIGLAGIGCQKVLGLVILSKSPECGICSPVSVINMGAFVLFARSIFIAGSKTGRHPCAWMKIGYFRENFARGAFVEHLLG
jgi:hypothetical protein